MKFDAVEYQNEINVKIDQEKRSLSGTRPISIATGNAVYKIDAKWVDFVDQTPFITPIPQSESFVVGICHARGRVLTVVDIATALGDSAGKVDKLIVLKGRNLAIRTSLASDRDHEGLPSVDLQNAVFRNGAHFFNYLT